jgi:ligand-binding sensor domain-containing protein
MERCLNFTHSSGKIAVVLIGLCFVSFSLPQAQTTAFNFRHLTDAEGLSDGVVHAFVQDQYGFMWIGTSYGLDRFDGINIKSYFAKNGDTTSLGNNFIQSLYLDSKSNLWIGTFTGVCRYDYSTNRFINYKGSSPTIVNDILEDKNGKIWLGTNDGLWDINEKQQTIQPFTNKEDKAFKKTFYCLIRQLIASPGGDWYMATAQGIRIFNPLTYAYSELRYHPAEKFSLSNDAVVSVALDASGNLWATCTSPHSYLNKIDFKQHVITAYDHFITADPKWKNNVLQRVFTDSKGRLWITAGTSGLSLYNAATDQFSDFANNPFIPNSVISNQNITVYQSRDGIIWLGTAGYGLSYFNPDKNLFNTVYPFLHEDYSIIDTWCRGAVEDKEGNIWLATSKGVAEYDPQWNLLTTIANDDKKPPVLYTNSVRSILRDSLGDIWIGTAKGLNRYHPATGTTDFFNEKQGILQSFFWMMAEDNKGEVWLGAANGLFRYKRNENRFDDLRGDSILSPYAFHNIQALYIDHHNRMWIGVLDVGLVMYDIDRKQKRVLTTKDSLISDTRFSSFAEDQDGMIWIGSEEGLTMYDPVHNHSRFFSRENGLPSDRTNNLLADSLNRIWIGTSNGLCVLNKERNNFKRFDVTNGLLTNHFNEQSAYAARNGLFIYPTYKGFLLFHPESYKENRDTVSAFVTSFKIGDKEIDPNTNELQELKLQHNQNFFNIELIGLNYMNPSQCRYAYQLEPFDHDWIYGAKREINYTNVPAGQYTFKYKVITDNPDWNVPEKVIRISISQIFYKTWWFMIVMTLLLGSGIIILFRYRMLHREKILVLNNKAQVLEKEKTLVMYENLKQHLNPHFLFNSLTSLSSLIRVDQQMAGDFLEKMSKVYRYILKNRDNETVPLSEELNFVNMYIQLQKTRFEKSLEVVIKIDDESKYRKIPPVTLQNLVENAIKHNVADVDFPLIIELYIEDDYLVVRNNLQRKKFVETSNKQGLANMKSLYHYLSRKPMIIEEDQHYFTVKVPLL